MLENAGSTPTIALSVLNVSAPEILQRPAPQPGAPLFGAPRPERPSAPANPAVYQQTLGLSAGVLAAAVGCAHAERRPAIPTQPTLTRR